MKSNRYIIAFAGVILHLMLGSTYAWSVYRNPIIRLVQNLVHFIIDDGTN